MSARTTDDALEYPPGNSPEPGQSIEILPGLLWLRMPLPFLLGHINLWLLRDHSGWTIVDTGLFTSTTRKLWPEVLEQQLNGDPITRILVTHLHPDHVGCAGWLAERCAAPLWMSRQEYLLCRVLVADTGKPAPREGIEFYTAAGFPQQAVERYEESFGMFGKVVSPMPQSYNRLYDGMQLRIGDHCWEVVMGNGHSPEHACLFSEELNTLISGDQILPTISSNVSVFPTEPNANPLDDWLRSISRLKKRLPKDVLVLPAHGRPFRGVHARLDQLRQEHEAGLDQLRQLGREPIRSLDTFSSLFNSKINDGNLIMATGEAIAHLNYLVHAGEMESKRDENGVRWYQMKA